MPISPQQIQTAQQRQFVAAQDTNSRIRVIAGPGTGKSRCIEERVNYLLAQGNQPNSIFVISFTRASSRDLKERVVDYCTRAGRGQDADIVNVSTMHSLALRTLRGANLLQGFPADPIILDDWEQANIFDNEYSSALPPTSNRRAREVRQAYDAHWQTLQALHIYNVSPPISQVEQQAFVTFHQTTKMVYSCLLPGEVVRLCVDEMRMGNIDPARLPGIKHIIVDEYQDLNECDQEFVRRIADSGASLFVAGDDDQSIYAFRHAAPLGIQNFVSTYRGASDHQLQDCFRSTQAILGPASSLISVNPSRIPKVLNSLWSSANPPVQGAFHVWRFNQGVEEARAIAESCHALITQGMPPNDILVLVGNVKVQVPLLTQEFDSRGVPYELPRGNSLLDSDMTRLVFSILRILKNSHDYVAHRTILGLRRGIGPGTCSAIAFKCVSSNLNFRELFYVSYPTSIFSTREDRAIQEAATVVQQISQWALTDTLQTRAT